MATGSPRLRKRSIPEGSRQETAELVTRDLEASMSMGNYRDDERRTVAHRLAESMEPVASSLSAAQQPVTRSLAEAMAQIVRVSERPVQSAFLARALNALARVTSKLGDETLGSAAGASSDFAVLMQALEEPASLDVLLEADPLAEARLRGLEIRERLLQAEGGTLSVEHVAKLLGITRQAVDKQRRAGRLLALPIGHHRYAYPAWQLDLSGMLPGLKEVLEELDTEDPWTRVAFFLGENSYLDGVRPLDELRRGNVHAVQRAAWFLGKNGAP